MLEFCRVVQERRIHLHWCPQGRWTRRLQKSSHGVWEGDASMATFWINLQATQKKEAPRCLQNAQDKQHSPLPLVSGENFKAKGKVS